jgi:collagenase-like PrtC family protease
MTLSTREGEPFLTLNGIQTQSARPYNLLDDVDALRQAGVDVLRLSPQARHSAELIATFRARIEGTLGGAEAASKIAALGEPEGCNGFWHGRPGLERIAAHS